MTDYNEVLNSSEFNRILLAKLRNRNRLLNFFAKINGKLRLSKNNFSRDDSWWHKKSLNGQVFIDSNLRFVVKVLDKKFEPNFLENEKYSSKILQEKFNPMLFTIESEKEYVLVSEYIFAICPTKFRTIRKRWAHKEFLTSKKNLPNHHVSIDELLNQLKRIQIHESQYFDMKKINRMLEKLIDLLYKFRDNSKHTYMTSFAHGDLVPSNILISNKGLRIIDWTNGGIHNFLYDFFVILFYNDETLLWDNFSFVDLNAFFTSDEKYLYELYLNAFEDRESEKMPIQEFRLNIVICLIEITIKNFWRHLNDSSYKDGNLFLDKINDIITKIYTNYSTVKNGHI